MSPAPLVLAAALLGWAPVFPAPPEAPAETAEPSVEQAPEPAETAAPTPPPVATPVIQPAIIAKAPVVVRTVPAPALTPTRTTERGKLQSRWWFWAIAGGLFASTIAVTIVATRPGPQAYGGNTPPYTISFP